MLKFTNNASATLAGSITGSSTSAVLTAGNGSLFPALGANEYFFATLVDSSNNLEVIKVTARSGDTLTIQRGQDGTVAKPYATGDKVELRLVAAVFQELIQRDGTVDFTGQITVPQGTAAGKAINASRQILTSSNLTGGGDLTADRTLDLSDTGVGAGSVGSASAIPVLTIDAKGRVTAKSTAALDLSPKMDKDGSVNPIIRNTAPTISLNDTDGNVTKKIHHNADLIGFLSNDDNWLMYGNNGGQMWSRNYGWLHDYFFSATSNCFRQAGNCSGAYTGAPNCHITDNCYNCGDFGPNSNYLTVNIFDGGGTIRLGSTGTRYNCNCNC